MRRFAAVVVLTTLSLSQDVYASRFSLGVSRDKYGESVANDMNNAGQVALIVRDKDGTPHAAFFERGKVSLLKPVVKLPVKLTG
jgi:hypothetical protein